MFEMLISLLNLYILFHMYQLRT